MQLVINKNYWERVIAAKPEINRITDKIAEQRFNKEQKRLMELVDEHRISQELEAGPQNSSVIASLARVEGDLFSFLGFPAGYKPVQVLKRAIKAGMRLEKTSVNQSKTKRYKFIVPDLDEVAVGTPMEYLEGRSWLVMIEEGIDGLSHYLTQRFKDHANKESMGHANIEDNSRSGTAIQIKGVIRHAVYQPQKYYTAIINKWKRSFE